MSSPLWLRRICVVTLLLIVNPASHDRASTWASEPVVSAAAPRVIARRIPGDGQPVVARTDGNHTIHVASNLKGSPVYHFSADAGKSFSRPLDLVDSDSKQPGLEYIVWDMAVTADGAVHVILGNNAWKLKLPHDQWGCFYTSRQPDEDSFAPLRNINHKPSEGFSLAVRDDGLLTIVWMADKLYANISTNSGRTFEPAVEIDPEFDPCNCCTTSSIYGADGSLAILYREETNNDRDMYLALWNQQSGAKTRTRISSTLWHLDACPMTYYSIARNGNGYTAAWPTRGKIYLAGIDGRGHVQAPGEISTAGTSGNRTGVLALPTASGHRLAIWKHEGQLGWQAFDSAGKSSQPADSIASAGAGAAAVVTADGHIVLLP